VATEPHIVFPGNVQGRTIRETGAKGAVVVTVVDHEVAAVERVDLDVIRWARLEVDCGGHSSEDVPDLIRAALGRLHGGNASGRPLVARVSLSGEMADAGSLHDRAATLRDDVRGIAASISPDLHIEKVKVLVTEPARDGVALSDDLATLIDEAATDPALAKSLESDLERFMLAASTTLDGPEDGELRHSAASGDWPAVVRMASLALRSRLTREA
jgi:exonuclease SbcD